MQLTTVKYSSFKVWTIVLVLMLFVCNDGFCKEDQNINDEYLNLIKNSGKLYKEKKYKEAVFVLVKARNIDSTDFMSYQSMGLCFYAMKENKKAETEFNMAYKLVKKEEGYYVNLANINAHLGFIAHRGKNYEKAINKYHEALKYEPDYQYVKERLTDAYNNLANIKKNEGNLEAAEKLIKRAIEIDRDHEVIHYTYGNIRFAQSKFDMALTEYIVALDLGFNNPMLYYQLSRCFKHKEDYQKAIEYIKVAIKLKEDEPPYWNKYGLLLFATKKYQESIKAFKKAISIKEYAIYYYNLAEVYFELKEYEKALNAFKKSLEIKDNFSEDKQGQICYEIARIYKRLKDLDKALGYAQKSLALQESKAWPNKMIGEIKFMRGRKEEANEYFEKASSLAPESFRIHKGMRWFLHKNAANNEDFKLAIKFGLIAYNIDEKNAENIVQLAWCYYWLKDVKNTKKYLELAKKINPKHEGIRKLEKKLLQEDEGLLKDSDGLILLNPPADQNRAIP